MPDTNTEERWVAWINCLPYLFPASFSRTADGRESPPTMNDIRTLREDFLMDPPITEMDDIVVSKITVTILQKSIK